MFDEITASSLVAVDLQGRKLDPDAKADINPAGFLIHSAIHAARPDVQCVLHTHSQNGIAVATHRAGLLPLSQQSLFVLASLGYHDYEGVALNDEERPRLVRDLADRTHLILRNHGLLTVGSTVADAFLAMYIMETACSIQIKAQSGSTDLVQIQPEILAGIEAQAKQVTRGLGAGLAWPGLLRKLDRVDPSYRT